MEVLSQLEGKDVYISTYGGAHSHFVFGIIKGDHLKIVIRYARRVISVKMARYPQPILIWPSLHLISLHRYAT
jgi:hypothetical protein